MNVVDFDAFGGCLEEDYVLVLRRQGDPILVRNGWLRRGLQREEGTTPKKLEKGAKTCNRAAQAEG